MKVEASVDGKLYLGCRKCQGVTDRRHGEGGEGSGEFCAGGSHTEAECGGARASGDQVLHSMIASRRLRYDFAADGKD